MESRTSAERRVRPGKTVGPRPTKLKAWAYKEFKVGDLFIAQTGDVDLQQKDVNGKGLYLINSGVEAQGIKGRTDREAKVFERNTITVDFWGNAYYRDFEYKMATHNHVFSLSGEVIKNRNIGLYLVSTMLYMKKLFSYNNMGTWTKIKELSLRLPIDQTGGIDFAFMESRIREMEESRIREMEAYLKVAGFEDCGLTIEEQKALVALQNKKFLDFKIDELFAINTGRDIIIGRVQDGTIPLISHQHDNNGISKNIKRLEGRRLFEHSKTIALADRGVFYATTQIEDFHIGTRVKALAFKDGAKNEEVRLFFVTAINKLQIFFTDYLVNATDKLPNLQIKLPVTSEGKIDYPFMELYIRAQEKLAIQKVKDWRAKEISTTRTLVQNEDSVTVIKPQRSYAEWEAENNAPKMVAEDIIIPGSLEVRLRNTKKEELLDGDLNLILMYAISPVARKKTESVGKIALGIKEEQLARETVKALESVRYIMFHYWKNSEARPFKLTVPTRIVNKQDIPEGFLVRQEKDAKQYLLIEYDPSTPAELGEYDILKAQRKGSNRYIPFVCKVENIK